MNSNLKNLLIPILLAFIVIYSCKKNDEPEKNPDNTTENALDFTETDPHFVPILNAYAETYNFAVNTWKYRDHYNLSDFNLILIAGQSKDSLKSAYMYVSSKTNYKGDTSNTVSIENSLTNGSKAIRMNDSELLNNAVKDLQEGQIFTRFENNLVFLFDKDFYSAFKEIGYADTIDFIVHEGYHLFPQNNFVSPPDKHAELRFDILEDYPHDLESFTLIMAGVKLAELAYQETNPEQLTEYLKMQYVIFKELVNNDTTRKDYISDYYLYYCWTEGAPTFVGIDLTANRSFYFENQDRYRSLSESLKYEINNAIDKNITSIVVNDEEIITRYPAIVDSSFYTLGFLPFVTLDKLGETDVFEQTKNGKGPLQLLEDYIEQHSIVIDEDEVLQTIKNDIPGFNWENEQSLMERYIELWE